MVKYTQTHKHGRNGIARANDRKNNRVRCITTKRAIEHCLMNQFRVRCEAVVYSFPFSLVRYHTNNYNRTFDCFYTLESFWFQFRRFSSLFPFSLQIRTSYSIGRMHVYVCVSHHTVNVMLYYHIQTKNYYYQTTFDIRRRKSCIQNIFESCTSKHKKKVTDEMLPNRSPFSNLLSVYEE